MKRFTLTFLLILFVVFSSGAQVTGFGPGDEGNATSFKSGVSLKKSVAREKAKEKETISKQNNQKSTGFSLFYETFSTGSLPQGWSNIDNAAAGAWLFNNPASRSLNSTTGSTGFAIFDSDRLGNDSKPEDADLITPAIDCSSLTAVIFSFEHYFYSGFNGAGDVSVSVDNGLSWTVLESWGSTSTANATLEEYDISSYAAGKSQVKVKWHWTGNYSWWWAIDDVNIFSPPEHDLQIKAINASPVLPSNAAASIVVTVRNAGLTPESAYSVTLSDGSAYSRTIDVTTEIAYGQTSYVTFDDWIPGDGNYTLTATVSSAGDMDAANNFKSITVLAIPQEHDLGIINTNIPSSTLSDSVITPSVTVKNLGSFTESLYSVSLSDGGVYNSTVDMTTEIAPGDQYAVSFADWTPATGNYTLTAILTLAGDALGSNNVVRIPVTVSPAKHDLEISTVKPAYFESDSTVIPKVTVLNSGDYSESEFDVVLSDGSNYRDTINVSFALAEGNSYEVTFPEWLPVDATYTLTAEVILDGDADESNDILSQECKVIDTRIAYAMLFNGSSYFGRLNVPMNTFTEISSVTQLQGMTWKDDVLYAISFSGIFGTVDIETGAFSTIGSIGISVSFCTALNCDPVTGKIYLSTLSGGYPSFTIGLYTIDPATGMATLVANSSHMSCAAQFAFDNNGNLYAAEHYPGENGKFYSVDKTTAEMTLIGDVGGIISSNFQPLTWDFHNNIMYLQASKGSNGNMQGTYQMNLETGKATLVGEPYDKQIISMVIPDLDARLSHLSVDNVAVAGFRPGLFIYDIVLPSGTTTLSKVEATAFYPSSEVLITDITEYPGSATVVVTAKDGTKNTYTINFTVLGMDEASLADLQVNGETVTGFESSTYSYTYELPYGTTVVPSISAVAKDVNAILVITDATELPGTSTVVITAHDGIATQTYSINFTVAPASADASLSSLDVDGSAVEGFQPDNYSYDVLLPFGSTDVPAVNAVATDSNAGIVINNATVLPGTTAVVVTAQDGITQQTYNLNFTLAPASDDASLSALKVNDDPVTGFSPENYTYNVELHYGVTEVPVVTAITEDENAVINITDAAAIPGTTTVIVIAQDGTTQLTYTINFTLTPVSSDATLSDLRIKGITVEDFDPAVFDYEVILPSASSAIPMVTATTSDDFATKVITNPNGLPGAVTVAVTAQDGTTQNTYTISFLVAEINDATLSDLQINGTTVYAFDPSVYSYDVEFSYGTTDMPLITVTTTDIKAVTNIAGISDYPGSAVIVVTANDGLTQLTYNVNFTVALPLTDATLSDLTVDGVTVTGFNLATYVYNVVLAEGTTAIPEVNGTVNDLTATMVITDALSLPGTSTVTVTAQDGTTILTYTVNFTVYDGVNDQKENDLRVYPVPSDDKVYIRSAEMISEIAVISVSGQVLLRSDINRSDYDLDVTTYKNGIYFLRIVTTDGVITKKIQVLK